MPNIKSAKKRVRVIATKSLRNKIIKSDLKTDIKKSFVAIETNDANKVNIVRNTIKKIDKANAKGVLHKNTAARKKSVLTCKLNAIKS